MPFKMNSDWKIGNSREVSQKVCLDCKVWMAEVAWDGVWVQCVCVALPTFLGEVGWDGVGVQCVCVALPFWVRLGGMEWGYNVCVALPFWVRLGWDGVWVQCVCGSTFLGEVGWGVGVQCGCGSTFLGEVVWDVCVALPFWVRLVGMEWGYNVCVWLYLFG